MRILHLDSGREMRGGQWQVLRLMRGLKRLGHTSLLLSLAGSPLAKIIAEEGFDASTIGFRAIRRWRKQADVVHAHDARSHTQAVLAGVQPLVVSRRVIFPVKQNALSRWKYGRPQRFLAVSHAVAAELARAGVPEGRVEVVYDGIPSLPLTWNPEGPIVMPVFRDPQKAFDLALAAGERAGRQVRPSENLEADLRGSSLMVYLTHSEGLGSAPLLAMSAGIPVIASNIGGLREIVQNGRNGFLVENDAAAVEGAIRQFYESPEQMRAFSFAARQSVHERFTEERMVRETLAVYESVTGAV